MFTERGIDKEKEVLRIKRRKVDKREKTSKRGHGDERSGRWEGREEIKPEFSTMFLSGLCI